jgi:Armadillo/beta-catenin-like repeat
MCTRFRSPPAGPCCEWRGGATRETRFDGRSCRQCSRSFAVFGTRWCASVRLRFSLVILRVCVCVCLRECEYAYGMSVCTCMSLFIYARVRVLVCAFAFLMILFADTNKVAIAAAGAIYPLVEMLRSSSEYVRSKAAAALCNLAVHGAQFTQVKQPLICFCTICALHVTRRFCVSF